MPSWAVLRLTLWCEQGADLGIQEVLDLTPRQVHFDAPAFVRVCGKGRRERLCPLLPQTLAWFGDSSPRRADRSRMRYRSFRIREGHDSTCSTSTG